MRRWIGLLILSLVGFLGFLNQQLLALLLDPVKRDLLLSDTQIGLLNGLGIAVFYAIAAIPLGWLADRYDRRLVLGLCMVVWSLATASCGLAMSYVGYSVGAIAMAMGEAAMIPIIYAMIPTIFSDKERLTANTIVYAIIIVAGGLSFIIGGIVLDFIERLQANGLAQNIASWRVLFVLAGALGIPVALLLVVVPPARTKVPVSSSSQQEGFYSFLATNGVTIACLFLALSLYGTAWFNLGFWTPAILGRVYGYDAALAGKATGIVMTIATIAGVGAAWWLTSKGFRGYARPSPLGVVQLGCWVALPAVLSLSFAPNAIIFLGLIGIAIGAIVMATAMAPTICQDVAPNIFSSRTIALFPIVGLIPRAISPSAVGAISDWVDNPTMALPIAVSLVCAAVLPMSIILLRLIDNSFLILVMKNRSIDGDKEESHA